MKIKEVLEAIRYHEDEAEKMRHIGWKWCAAEHLRKAKELKVLLMIID